MNQETKLLLGWNGKSEEPASGIQPHSKGNAYPLAIVAYDTGRGPVVKAIENLATGQVAGMQVGDVFVPYGTVDTRYAVDLLDAIMLRKPLALEVTWKAGRPYTYYDTTFGWCLDLKV